MNDNKNEAEFNSVISDEMRKKIDELATYFDSIQIFATKHNGDEFGTTRFILGNGNYFATVGLIKLWAKEQSIRDIVIEEDDE